MKKYIIMQKDKKIKINIKIVPIPKVNKNVYE